MLVLAKRLFIACSLLVVSGCATLQLNNLFQDYASQFQPVRAALSQGNVASAIQQVPKAHAGDTNYQLSLVEQGRLAFLQGDINQSRWWFEQSYQALETQRNQAKLRLGQGLERVNTLVTNDNAIAYQMPAYEQSMMHGYQALNYALAHDLEGALVEVRRANQIQEAALVQYEDELIEANAEQQNVDFSYLDNTMSALTSKAGQIKNGFQNAYTFYLSGIFYEAAGQLNDAYIDYKKALEIFPDNQYLQRDVLRLGSVLGMNNDLEYYNQQLGKAYVNQLLSTSVLGSKKGSKKGGQKGSEKVGEQNTKQGSLGHKQGQLVVVYEQSLIEAKQEQAVRLPIWTSGGDPRFYSVSVPSYVKGYSNISDGNNSASSRAIELQLGKETLTAETIVNLQALVAKQLAESLPSIVSRQVLRLVAKEQVRRKLSKEGGDVGNILAGLYNLASERADTRSWLTLPGDVQIIKAGLPAGEHQLSFNRKNLAANDTMVTIAPNKITLVVISEIGQVWQFKQAVL
ncbi:COG3014 family protein [Thalassotalea montiporae]